METVLCNLHGTLRRPLYPPDAFAPYVGSGSWLAGEVNAIVVGSWQWSCTANCAGTTCTLAEGAADLPLRTIIIMYM